MNVLSKTRRTYGLLINISPCGPQHAYIGPINTGSLRCSPTTVVWNLPTEAQIEMQQSLVFIHGPFSMGHTCSPAILSQKPYIEQRLIGVNSLTVFVEFPFKCKPLSKRGEEAPLL